MQDSCKYLFCDIFLFKGTHIKTSNDNNETKRMVKNYYIKRGEMKTSYFMLIREEIEGGGGGGGGGEPKPCYDLIKITHKLSNIKYITVLPERKS